MVHIVFAIEDKLAVVTVDDISSALLVVVLLDLLPGSQVLRAISAVMMSQLVALVLAIADHSAALVTLDHQLLKEHFGHPANLLEPV